MPKFVLLDTNQFAEKTRLLNTGLGPSLLYITKIRDAKIALPDVVRSESTRYVKNEILRLNQSIGDSLRQIREYLGQSADPPLPGLDEVDAQVKKRFAGLSKWIEELPLSDEVLKASAKRVLEKIAPSHWDGEDAFRDSIIWESLLRLPAGSEVYFASSDARAFFNLERKGDAVLLERLQDDAKSRNLTVTAFKDLESLVKKLQGDDPVLDEPRARHTIESMFPDAFVAAMTRWSIDRLDQADFRMDSYLTEAPGMLFVQFVSAHRADQALVDGLRYENVTVRFEGECTYDPFGLARDVRITREALLSSDGREIQATGMAYASGTILLGTPRRSHTFRSRMHSSTT